GKLFSVQLLMKIDNGRARLRKVSRATPPGAPVRFLSDGLAIRALQLIVFAISVFIASCVAPDTQHHVIISAREQKLAVLDRDNLMAIYPITTSKFGLGDWPGGRRTPLSELGMDATIGAHVG